MSLLGSELSPVPHQEDGQWGQTEVLVITGNGSAITGQSRN